MSQQSERIVSWNEYSKHISPQDCWVLIDGYLYDVSDYLVEHPGGDDILIKYSGIDASVPFNEQQHSQYAKSLRDARRVGKIQTPEYNEQYRQMLQEKKKQLKAKLNKQKTKRQAYRENISKQQIAKHNSEDSCWLIIKGKVYDVTDYMESHPGGEKVMLDKAGQDATKAFQQANHSLSAVQKRQKFCIGTLRQQSGSSSLVVIALIIAVLIAGGWFLFSGHL